MGRSHIRCALLRCADKMFLVFTSVAQQSTTQRIRVNATSEIHGLTVLVQQRIAQLSARTRGVCVNGTLCLRVLKFVVDLSLC